MLNLIIAVINVSKLSCKYEIRRYRT